MQMSNRNTPGRAGSRAQGQARRIAEPLPWALPGKRRGSSGSARRIPATPPTLLALSRGTLLLALLLASGAVAQADYPAERAAAVKLIAAGKDAEALAAFVRMAETAASDVQKSDALDQAALCAHRLKQEEQAMTLARRIPLAPSSKTCRMRLLAEGRKWSEVLAQFRDEKLDAWPEYLAAEAYFLRGTAFAVAGEGAPAVADLEQAGALLTDDNALGLALNALGAACRDILKDDTRALEAYRRVYRTRNLYKQCAAAIAAAGILSRQGKHDEALRELGRVDLAAVTLPYWRSALLAAYGGTLARQGRKAEAIARYREALKAEGIHPAQKATVEKALQELEAAPRTP